MPDLGATDIVEVVIEGKLDAQQTISTFFYKPVGLGGAFDLFDELEDFITKLRAPGKLMTKYQDVCSDQLVDLNMFVQVVYPIRYRYTNGAWDNESGAVDELCFPANVQASITRAAERAGRRYVGHLAVPAVPITAIENSQLTDGYMIDLNVLAGQMLATVVLTSGTEMRPVLYNKNHDPVFSYLKIAFPQPTSRVIRRRTVGLGS